MDKKKKATATVLGAISVLCYIVMEILWLHALYSRSGLEGAISQEMAEQIKNSGSIRNIFEMLIYVFFMIYSWNIWNIDTEKKYIQYLIRMAYVIGSVLVAGCVFLGIEYLLMGTVSINYFTPGIILVWFSVLNLLLMSGMQAKKDKQVK